MKVVLAVVLAVAVVVVQEGAGMTVSQKEADDLPLALRPIVPGGSWFDDMAIKRLRKIHQDLREVGETLTPDHEDHPEEQFIMSRLKNPDMTFVELDPKVQELEKQKERQPETMVQSTREAMRNFLRHHTRQHEELEGEDLEDDQSKVSVTTSTEFMDKYEKELEGFFKNFMSAMLQAEIGGVSIENHSEEDRTIPDASSGDRTIPDDSSGDRTIPDDSSGDRTIPDDSSGDRTFPDHTSGDRINTVPTP